MTAFHSASVSRVDMVFVRALPFADFGLPPLCELSLSVIRLFFIGYKWNDVLGLKWGGCRFRCDRVAACGVVFVDENINLPALKHSPVKMPLSVMSAIYLQEVLPSN
jgi:hypothetical protein